MKRLTMISSARNNDPYLKLVMEFPLKVIRDDEQLDAATTVLDRLAVRSEGSLSPGEQDYFDTLTSLVSSYEQEHHAIHLPRVTPLAALKHLMKEAAMKPADLGRILGSASAATMILKGTREMSKSHIRAVANHFKVDPGLFL